MSNADVLFRKGVIKMSECLCDRCKHAWIRETLMGKKYICMLHSRAPWVVSSDTLACNRFGKYPRRIRVEFVKNQGSKKK